MTMFNSLAIIESDDTTSLTEVLPLRPVADLTDDQERDLADAVRSALRPLVEAEWATRGVTVERWSADPLIDGPKIVDAPDDQQPRADLHADVRNEQISVWGRAYEALDDDALWAAIQVSP